MLNISVSFFNIIIVQVRLTFVPSANICPIF